MDSVEKLLPERLLTHLFDREFDDVKLLRYLAERRYVIRCRMLSRIGAVHGEKQSIGKHLESLKLQHSGEVTRRLAQSTQTYSMWIGETEVTLTKPSLRGVQKRRQKPQPGAPLRVRVVVSELRQPGEKPLRWVLLTNLAESALSVVERYLERWKMEIRHPWCVLSRVSYVGETGIFVDGVSQRPGSIPLHVLLSPLSRSASASRYDQATYTRGGPASRVLMQAHDMRDGMVTRRADSKSATGWEGLRAWQRACHGGMVPGAVLVGVAQRAQAA